MNNGDVDNTNEHDADQPPDGLGWTDRPRQSPPASALGTAAADLLGPRLVLATQDEGYTAALKGDHMDSCPWLRASSDRELALRKMWIRGYAAGRTDLRAARDKCPE